jgi:hypothetical protein
MANKYHDDKGMNQLIKKHIALEGKRRPKSSQTFRVLNAVFKAHNEVGRKEK